MFGESCRKSFRRGGQRPTGPVLRRNKLSYTVCDHESLIPHVKYKIVSNRWPTSPLANGPAGRLAIEDTARNSSKPHVTSDPVEESMDDFARTATFGKFVVGNLTSGLLTQVDVRVSRIIPR
ncbi:Uncharacterised protein at_DN0522 [Pycnogonum litorale]